MRVALFFAVVAATVISSTTASPNSNSAVRGVPKSKKALYVADSDGSFKCLQGTKKIPFSAVNDDYCDCPDGSDEPGTSACPLGFYHCVNAWHVPKNIQSSRVNDGVCDCCDGSDEYATGVCTDNCKEVGAEARRKAQEHAEIVRQGLEIQKDMIQNAALGIEEKKKELEALKAEKLEAEKKEQDLKAALDEAQKVYDAWKEIDDQRKAADELKKQQEQAETSPEQDSQQTEPTSEIANESETPGIVVHNDENDEFLSEMNLEEIERELAQEQIEEEDEEDIDVDDVAASRAAEIRHRFRGRLAGFKPPVPQTEQEPAGPEEEALKKARNDHQDAIQARSSIDTKISDIERALGHDYGVNDVYWELRDKCFDFDTAEYKYELCFFKQSTQKSKNGYSSTSLGNWGKWVGEEDNKYSKQLYEFGQSCWNGPMRSAKIELSCASETKILDVTEPAKCEYLMRVVTPAACAEAPKEIASEVESNSDEDVNDEL